jgi:hypothetical protein
MAVDQVEAKTETANKEQKAIFMEFRPFPDTTSFASNDHRVNDLSSTYWKNAMKDCFK